MINGVLEFLFITVPAFLAVLTLVVFVHEYGHFQVGRWFKIQVKSFSIGMGSPLIQRTDKHGTVWKISKIPIGGFVSWVGDTDVSSTKPADMPDDPRELEAMRQQGLYHAQKPGVRAAVAFAGPAANFIFSTIVFAAMFMIVGVVTKDLPARVDLLSPGLAAEKAGIKVGDVITAVDGNSVRSISELQAAVAPKANVPIVLSLVRDDAPVTVRLTPTPMTGPDMTGVEQTRGVLGIQARPHKDEFVKSDPLTALGQGAQRTWQTVADTGAYLGNIFSGKASAGHIAGPVGMMDVSGQVAKSSAVGATLGDKLGNLCVALLSLAAFLSVAIGIANLLPIPVLDGGHILLCAIEKLRGKALDENTQAIGFNAGLLMVLGLFLFATWNDLQRLNVLEFLRGILS